MASMQHRILQEISRLAYDRLLIPGYPPVRSMLLATNYILDEASVTILSVDRQLVCCANAKVGEPT